MQRLAFPDAIGVENLLACDEGLENLFNEKGIALRKSGDGIKQISICQMNRVGGGLVLSKDGMQHRLDLDMRQPLKHNFLIEPLAVKLRQPVFQAAMHFVAAIGRQDKQWQVSTMARQVVQELEARFITPMNILYREQNGLLRSQICEEVCERHEKTALLLLWLQRRCRSCWWRYYVEMCQVACACLQVGGVCGEQFFCRRRPEQIENGRIGIGTVSRKTVALEQQKMLLFSIRLRLGHQARLTDSCLSADENYQPRRASSPGDESMKSSQFCR